MLLIFVLQVLLITVQGQVQCPKFPNGTCQDFLFPIEDACENYFTCSSCQIEVGVCPGDNHFDPVESECQSRPCARCDPSAIIGTMFSVSRDVDGDLIGPEGIVYDNVIVNNQHPFDHVSSTVMTNSNGTYFFHLSAGTSRGRSLSTWINGLPFDAGIFSDNTGDRYDVHSRDIIAKLNYSTILSVFVEANSTIYSSASKANLWSGFRIDEYMNDVVAFSASTNETVSRTGSIVFDDVLVNDGDGYDETTGFFTADTDGIYLLTFSALVPTDGRLECHFDSMTNGRLSYIFRTTRSNISSYDSISKTILVELTAGEQIRMFLENGQVDGAVPNGLTFSGFKYDPITFPQAWSLYGISSHDAGVDPVPFEVVSIDVGELFDTSTNLVTINMTGFYYISLAVGRTTNSPVNVSLVVDSDELFSLYQSLNTGPYLRGDTVSQSIIAFLKKDNVLKLRVNSDSAIYSDPQKLMSFSGILLQASSGPATGECDQ